MEKEEQHRPRTMDSFFSGSTASEVDNIQQSLADFSIGPNGHPDSMSSMCGFPSALLGPVHAPAAKAPPSSMFAPVTQLPEYPQEHPSELSSPSQPAYSANGSVNGSVSGSASGSAHPSMLSLQEQLQQHQQQAEALRQQIKIQQMLEYSERDRVQQNNYASQQHPQSHLQSHPHPQSQPQSQPQPHLQPQHQPQPQPQHQPSFPELQSRMAHKAGHQNGGMTQAATRSLRCRHWAKGFCWFGSSCNFVHSGSPAAPTVQSCRHWITKGYCLHKKCSFKHDVKSISVPVGMDVILTSAGSQRAGNAIRKNSRGSMHQRISNNQNHQGMNPDGFRGINHAGPGGPGAQGGSGGPGPVTYGSLGSHGPHSPYLARSPSRPQSSASHFGLRLNGGSKVCRHWTKKGDCNLGNQCGFLHPVMH